MAKRARINRVLRQSDDWRSLRFPSILNFPAIMQERTGALSEDLDRIARALCSDTGDRKDPELARIMHAIGFFELQVRILDHQNARLQRDARIMAAIKFLEYFEESRPRSVGSSPAAFIDIPAYQYLLGIVFTAGGWNAIRHLSSAKEFDARLATLAQQSRMTASMVSLAYRFKMQNPDSKIVAGKTMAVGVVSKLQKSRGSTVRTLENRLSRAGHFAVLQYLILEVFPQLAPLRTGTKDFVRKLLGQSRHEKMAPLFAQYQDVSEKIGHQFSARKLDMRAQKSLVPSFVNCGLSEEERKAIRQIAYPKRHGLYQLLSASFYQRSCK